MMKKMKIMILLLAIFTTCSAPEWRCLYIERAESIQPYEPIWKAVCFVESSNNPYAYHMENNGHASIGIAQIQQSRVDDYNKRTGKNYQLEDMYDSTIAKKVFLHYAWEYKPWEVERIVRLWNGGPHGMKYAQTFKYYNDVCKYLASNTP